MRKILLITLILFSLNSQSQVWCTPGSVWHYQDGGLGFTGCKRLDYLYDTVINGKICQKMKEYRSGITTSSTYSYTRYFYTHTSNNVVFLLYGNSFDTLYNFNAIIGDKWRIPPVSYSLCGGSYVTVADTGHSIIQGQNLKWLNLATTLLPPNISWKFGGFVYERIGAVQTYPYAKNNACSNNVDAGIGGYLSVFSDQQISAYRYMNWSRCEDTFLSLSQPGSITPGITLYPNPSSGVLHMGLSEESFGKALILKISDPAGRLIKQLPLQSGLRNQSVDLKQLAEGLYLLTVCEGSKVIYQGKLIRQE
jgi:hypothetical protein